MERPEQLDLSLQPWWLKDLLHYAANAQLLSARIIFHDAKGTVRIIDIGGNQLNHQTVVPEWAVPFREALDALEKLFPMLPEKRPGFHSSPN